MEQSPGSIAELSLQQELAEKLVQFRALANLEEGEVRLLSILPDDSYDGYALAKCNDTEFLIFVNDLGWHCLKTGELNEKGDIQIEAEGVDILETTIVDLNSGALIKLDEHLDEDMVHGIVYAAAAYSDGDFQEQRKTFIFDQLSPIPIADVRITQRMQRDVIGHLQDAFTLL